MPSSLVTVIPIPIYRKQADFRQSKAWLRGFVGGRGTGKTRIGALDVCLRARNEEPWMCVSPSYPVMEESTWPTFLEVSKQLGVFIRQVKSPLPRIFFRTQDGGAAEIVFRSGDKPDSLLGGTKAGIWYDEASVMLYDAFLRAIPVLRWRGRYGCCLMTFTPRGRRHWTFSQFYNRVVDEEGNIDYAPKANSYLCHAHTLENPFVSSQFYENIKALYSEALAAQELGGEFIELEGLLFMRSWFDFVDAVPRLGLRVRYWDRAYTEGDGAHTAGVLMLRTLDDRYIVEDVVRGQWSPAARRKIMVETAHSDARKYDNEVMIYIEQEGAAGAEVGAIDIKALSGFPVFRDTVSRGHRFRTVDKLQLPGEAKITRAMPLIAQAEAGNVSILRATWNHQYLEEICAFPEYAYCDQVDASSGAFNKLGLRGGMDPGAIVRTDVVQTEESRFGVQLIRHRLQRQRR